MGPIPAEYAADDDGTMLIGGRRADALVAEAGGTPLFVYDLDLVQRQVERFRRTEAMVETISLGRPTGSARSAEMDPAADGALVRSGAAREHGHPRAPLEHLRRIRGQA